MLGESFDVVEALREYARRTEALETRLAAVEAELAAERATAPAELASSADTRQGAEATPATQPTRGRKGT